MIPTWSLWCQAWWKHPQPLIPHNLTQPSAFDHPSPFARNFLPTLSLWIMSASSKGRSSISYSMTTTTSAKIGFTTSLFVALDSTSVVVLYTWNVSMYFKKNSFVSLYQNMSSLKVERMWGKGDGALGRRKCRRKPTQQFNYPVPPLEMMRLGWVCTCPRKWRFGIAFTIFSRRLKGRKVQEHELAGRSFN